MIPLGDILYRPKQGKRRKVLEFFGWVGRGSLRIGWEGSLSNLGYSVYKYAGLIKPFIYSRNGFYS